MSEKPEPNAPTIDFALDLFLREGWSVRFTVDVAPGEEATIESSVFDPKSLRAVRVRRTIHGPMERAIALAVIPLGRYVPAISGEGT